MIPEWWVLHLLCCVGFCTILCPKVYRIFYATVQKFLLKALETTAHTFFFWSRFRLRNFFLGSLLLLRLSATIGFGLRLTISNVFSSFFSDLTS